VTRYFLRALAAHFRAGRTLFALTVLGIALGVGSVLSIQILNRNALGAFEGSLKAVSGEVDLTVLPRGPFLPESVFADVAEVDGVEHAFPLHTFEVALAGREAFFLEIVGTDLFRPVRIPWSDEAPRGQIGDVLGVPGWTAVTPELAREMGWSPGHRFTVTSGTRRVELTVGALVDFRRLTPLASRRLVVMDVAQSQHLFGAAGELTQIDVVGAPSADREDLAARLARAAGEGAEVVTPEQRRQRASGLMAAFRLNLTALSLISLFVGGFLVYAATQAALVRRRGEFGLLRSVGASPVQVLGIILAEVALLGALGVGLGIPLGWWAARANVETVSATLSNLYMLEEIETLVLPPGLFLLAAAIGAGGVLAGAAFPAIDVARKETKDLLAPFTLHERIGRASGALSLAGLAILAAGGIAAAWGGETWRPAGFVLAVALLLAMPLWVPSLLRHSAAWLPARGFGLLYGARTLGVRLGTTAFAVAALAVAVSMLVGITLMIGSFRRTVDLWIGETLRADVYVTTESWQRARRESRLDPAVERDLAALPGVRSVDRLRQAFVESGGRRITIGGAEAGGNEETPRFTLVEGEIREALRALYEGEAALVSEPFARRERLSVGDPFRFSGPDGEVSLPIAGIFHDYSSETGGAVVAMRTFERIFGPGSASNVALTLDEGIDAEAFADTVRARFAGVPLQVRSNRSLREEVFAIFDRTFAVTRLLQGMCLVVAAAGITLTLLVLARERVSELSLYRALGAGRRQIFGVFLGKGLGMAAFGLLLGSGGGIALALVLVFLINRTWFGWTIALHWPWTELAGQALTILAAAIAASLYPALRASRTPATELSRDDL
jgi:putative ABC transport system permease protein